MIIIILSPKQMLYKLHCDCCFPHHQSKDVSTVTLTLDSNIRQPSNSKMKIGVLTQSKMEKLRM